MSEITKPAPDHPLRAYRESHQLTQRELAKLLGVSDALITHIELGRRRVAAEKARQWESKLGIPCAVLCPHVFGDREITDF